MVGVRDPVLSGVYLQVDDPVRLPYDIHKKTLFYQSTHLDINISAEDYRDVYL